MMSRLKYNCEFVTKVIHQHLFMVSVMHIYCCAVVGFGKRYNDLTTKSTTFTDRLHAATIAGLSNARILFWLLCFGIERLKGRSRRHSSPPSPPLCWVIKSISSIVLNFYPPHKYCLCVSTYKFDKANKSQESSMHFSIWDCSWSVVLDPCFVLMF